MSPERWREVERIYHQALDAASERRDDLVEGACAGDESLREEVRSLLSFDDGHDNHQPEPAGDGGSASLAGRTLGRYRIASLLGSGAMGDVYLAHDTGLDRTVAVKVLQQFFTRDSEQVRRFEREAQSASRLNHPNIVTIMEVGAAGEHHFIATEFIEGQTLQQRLKALRSLWALTRHDASHCGAARCPPSHLLLFASDQVLR